MRGVRRPPEALLCPDLDAPKGSQVSKDSLPGLHIPDDLSGCGGQTKRHLLLKHPLGLPRQTVVGGHLTVNEGVQGEEKGLCPGPGLICDDQSPVGTQTVGNDLLVEVP